MFALHHGDCLEVLKTIDSESVDSVITDPPYGLKFMGKKWDHSVPSVDVWAECIRVLKPGGHLLCFAGTRTHHRMACNIEDAGFEVRDMMAWLYGSGFPKSHNLRDNWQGWGTALKPALEPITMARKPLIGTVAQNVLAHGTGALNVDGCRVGTNGGTTKANIRKGETNGERAGMSLGENISFRCDIATLNAGRWPANLIHDGLQEEWARYFYCPKASKKDRDEGCKGLPPRQSHERKPGGKSIIESSKQAIRGNHHPTVKPTELMAYLCRLVTPPGGVVLDPFMGSGSTGKAAILEGFKFIGIEREAEYIEISRARISAALERRGQKDG